MTATKYPRYTPDVRFYLDGEMIDCGLFEVPPRAGDYVVCGITHIDKHGDYLQDIYYVQKVMWVTNLDVRIDLRLDESMVPETDLLP